MEPIQNEDKGLSGLTNLGNTCFINSCVAVLSHTHELHEIINDSNESFITEAGDVEKWVGSSKKKLLENKEETIKYLQSLKK
jgi:ubiquitin C-terminal hydrolase